MDQKNNVRVVEEEKFGWTILSTVEDDEHTASLVKLVSQQVPDPLPGNETDKRVVMTERHGADWSESEQKGHVVNKESDEPAKLAHDEEDDDGDFELGDYGVEDGANAIDEDEGKVLPYNDSGRGSLWASEPGQESNGKQALIERQPEQKQGLMWRVSLVATLGFFGWVVMSGLNGGGKSVQSLKLHPCSIKDGEAVLSTL